MDNRAPLARNLGALTAGQVVAQLLNLVALVYLARHLGAHWFGVVQIGVAFSAYALLVAEWGMMGLGVREVARLDRAADVKRYAETHQGLLAVQAVGIGALGLLLLPRLPFFPYDPTLFLFYLALIVPQIFMQDWIGLGLERATWVSLARIVRSLVYAGLVLLLLRPLATQTGWPAHRLVPVLLIVAFVAGNAVIGGPVARWLGGPVWPRLPAAGEGRRRWRETTPIGASSLTLRVLLNVDILVLGVLAAPTVAGGYSAAAKVVVPLVIAMEVLWKALMPRLSRLASEADRGFRRGFNLYLAVVLAGLMPAAVGGVIVGPDLMAWLYEDRFPAAGRVFQVLVVAYPLLAVGWYFGNALIARDRQGAYFPPLLAAALVAMGGCIWLVPRYGAVGAACGMLAGHLLLCVSLGYVSRRELSPALWRPLAAIAAGCVLLVVAAWAAADWHLLPRIAAAAAVYGCAIAWPARRWPTLFGEPIVDATPPDTA
jgi:O-antigen/teichoic acid export membrane protein